MTFQVFHVKKTVKTAVDDVYLNMYRGQVTALLGHSKQLLGKIFPSLFDVSYIKIMIIMKRLVTTPLMCSNIITF